MSAESPAPVPAEPVPAHNPETRRITRRAFLAGVGVAALGAAGAAASRYWREIRDRAEWYSGAHLPLDRRIQRHFSYLTLEPDDIRRYVRDYEPVYGRVRRFGPPPSWLFTTFLLSSDFFVNGGDESRPVRYVTLYGARVSPCWNPCAIDGARRASSALR